MMDISVSTGASPADAAASVKSGRQGGKGTDANGGGGFSDVLNKTSSGADGNKQTAVNSDAQQPTSTTGDGNDAVGEAPRRPTPKAVIDVSDTSLVAQAQSDGTATGTDKTAQKTPRVDVKSIRKTADDATLAEDTKADDEVGPHATKTDKTVKTGKSEAKPATSDDTAVSDALSLLEQVPVDGVSVAAVLVGQKTVEAAPTDSKDKSSGKTKSKDDAVADVTGALAVTTSSADSDVPGAKATEGTEGQTFRLTRADNRNVSMDMHIGNEKDATETGRNVETVTVVDSRRYIGLAQNTNSAAVTAALSGDSEWAHAMQASSSLSNAAELSSTGKVVNTLKIQMNPIDLGLVTATLRLQGDALNVDLKVESAAAYRQLREDHGKMLESLRSQGYAVDGVTISMAPTPNTDAGSQSGAQDNSQQSFAQGQGGEARERQNQTGQRTAGGFSNVGESDSAGVAPGTSDSGGTGDVYL